MSNFRYIALKRSVPSLAWPTGKLSTIPPSQYSRPSMSTGLNNNGTAAEASNGEINGPVENTAGRPARMSVVVTKSFRPSASKRSSVR